MWWLKGQKTATEAQKALEQAKHVRVHFSTFLGLLGLIWDTLLGSFWSVFLSILGLIWDTLLGCFWGLLELILDTLLDPGAHSETFWADFPEAPGADF